MEDPSITFNNIVEAKPTNEDKPCDYNRSKQAPDSLGSMMLQSEKANQNGACDRRWHICIG